MAGVRFADVQSRPAEFLNLTSLTLEEFQVLVAPFEAAFQEHMAAWRLDGKPRTVRRFTVYWTCPLATPEDRLFFLLTYLKTAAVGCVNEPWPTLLAKSGPPLGVVKSREPLGRSGASSVLQDRA